MTGFKPTTPEGADEFKKIAVKIAKMGIGNAVRVDSASEIGSMQFKRVTKDHEHIIVKSRTGTESLLNTLK